MPAITATVKKSFATPSAKPCDVEYRLKRLAESLADTMMFLQSIDPSVYPETYAQAADGLQAAAEAVGGWTAPSKKARKSLDEKMAALKAAEEAKSAKAAAKAKAKATKAEAVKTVHPAFAKAQKAAANAELTAAQKSMAASGSAIERALAAAKARKDAKAVA